VHYLESSYGALGVDVRDVSADTRSALDVVEGEIADSWVELEQEGQRLANATAGTEDDDLGGLSHSVVSQCRPRESDCGSGRIRTLAADALKALRWTALRSDCDTWRAANMMGTGRDGRG